VGPVEKKNIERTSDVNEHNIVKNPNGHDADQFAGKGWPGR